jgi:DNA ligase (NAD+)
MTETIQMKMQRLGIPTVCPSCGGQLQWKSVDLVCNNIHCGEKLVKEVASFLIKNGVENATDTSLSNWGIVNFDDLLAFRSDGSKNQNNFLVELNKIFTKPKEELFSNMSFDGAGSTNINKLLDFYGEGDLELTTRVLYVNVTDLFFDLVGFPEGIGQKVIDKIKSDWRKNLEILNKVMKDSRYAPIAKVAAAVASGNLVGKSFLLTGTLTEGKKAIEKLITDNGGTIASSVSKTLSFLVCAPDSWGSSSKYVKADKLGVKILTEDELKGMI